MNEKELIDKRISLSFEFQRYLLSHPEVEEKIPQGAHIFFILENDKEFTKQEKKLAKKTKYKGEHIVFIKIKRLIPPFESRLVNPYIESVL